MKKIITFLLLCIISFIVANESMNEEYLKTNDINPILEKDISKIDLINQKNRSFGYFATGLSMYMLPEIILGYRAKFNNSAIDLNIWDCILIIPAYYEIKISYLN